MGLANGALAEGALDSHASFSTAVGGLCRCKRSVQFVFDHGYRQLPCPSYFFSLPAGVDTRELNRNLGFPTTETTNLFCLFVAVFSSQFPGSFIVVLFKLVSVFLFCF